MTKIIKGIKHILNIILCKPIYKFSLLLLMCIAIISVLGFFYTGILSKSTSKAAPGEVANGVAKEEVSCIDNDKVTQKAPRDVLIVVDPGHGGDDTGTFYGDMVEKNINLDIALRFGSLLKQKGIKVVFTREKDISVDLVERAKIANDLNATLFISVHNNRMPDNPGYKGTETLYCPALNDSADLMVGERLATIIQKELVNALNTVNNGIIARPNLAVLHRTKMPAIIAEIAYISNWSDRSRLSEDVFRQRAAEALTKGTLKSLGEMGAKEDSAGNWTIQG